MKDKDGFVLCEQFGGYWCRHTFEDSTHAQAWVSLMFKGNKGHYMTTTPRGRYKRLLNVDHRFEEIKAVELRRATLAGEHITTEEARIQLRELREQQPAPDQRRELAVSTISLRRKDEVEYKLGQKKIALKVGQKVRAYIDRVWREVVVDSTAPWSVWVKWTILNRDFRQKFDLENLFDYITAEDVTPIKQESEK